MQADWHEQHILLKVAFPVSARSDKATFEIPYGSVERPTTRNTPAEQAQFEVPALRWADISGPTLSPTSGDNHPNEGKGGPRWGPRSGGAPRGEGGVGPVHGFSLLNDSKYGYDAKDNVLRLSLLRSPTWPDPVADQGRHEFTYSLYPHGGTWREAMTVHQGYELNYGLIAYETTQHPGPLPAEKSFFGTTEDNVVITAVKQAADGDGLIVRFYEWAGKKGDIHLNLPQPGVKAWETNLMEVVQNPLALDATGKTLAVPTNPYEIKTVKVRFGAH